MSGKKSNAKQVEKKKAGRPKKEPKPAKPPKPAKELQPYCMAKDPPKGYRRGTMTECALKKQIRYYGVMRANPQVLELLEDKPNQVDKSEEKIISLSVRLKGLETRFKKLKAEREYLDPKDDKDEYDDITNKLKEVKATFDKIQKELKQLKK
jgi:hypothetical protein